MNLTVTVARLSRFNYKIMNTNVVILISLFCDIKHPQVNHITIQFTII